MPTVYAYLNAEQYDWLIRRTKAIISEETKINTSKVLQDLIAKEMKKEKRKMIA